MKSIETTYFLFTRDEIGNIKKFVGPILKSEIETCKKSEFEIYEQIQEMGENSFRLIYSEQYYNDFPFNWVIYISCLLESVGYDAEIHNPDIIDDNYNDDFDANKNVIEIINLCVITKDGDNICIRFDIEANAIDVAFVMQQLIKYTVNVFEVVIENYIHTIRKNQNEVILYSGDEAVEQYYNEKLNQWYLN